MNKRFQCVIGAREVDLNSVGHVDNGMMVRIFSEGRVRFIGRFGGTTGVMAGETVDVRWVVASNHVEYRHEVFYTHGEDYEMSVWVGHIGRSSFTIQSTLWTASYGSEDDPAAVLETAMVITDPETGRPCPIPDVMRSGLKKYVGPPIDLRPRRV